MWHRGAVGCLLKQVDVVEWGEMPVLMRLLPRNWGPMLTIPAEKVQKWTRTQLPEVLGIVRHPFSRHMTYEDFSLHSMLRVPDPKSRRCYVSSKLFRSTYQKCLVDEYRKTGNTSFHLTRSSLNLISYLERNGFTLTFLPESEFVKKEVKELRGKQSTDSVLMVSPTGFAFNPETAVDNAFMSKVDPKAHGYDVVGHPTVSDTCSTALHEFRSLHSVLTETAGIDVHVFEHNPEDDTPDAVFPNNWFTTHAQDGQEKHSIVLYPIKSESRRRERRTQIVDFVRDISGDKGLLDLRKYEQEGRFLEGTGSLILDRVNRLVYVSRSERSDIDLAHLWAKEMGYEDVIHFDAFDGEGRPVYHTNVLMSIGTHFAFFCLEAIPDPQQGNHLMDMLSKDRTVIPISRSQMSCFCGNVLELMDSNDLPVLLMSTQAFHAFSDEQLDVIHRHVAKIHHAPINTIERVGGGSVRCTIAELF